MNEIWPVVHKEREALIQDLKELKTQQWTTPSLCPDWDIHDVLAHLVDDAKTTRVGFSVVAQDDGLGCAGGFAA